MPADERRGRVGHRGDIERLRQLPHEGASERITRTAGADLVAVRFGSRAEPRVKIGCGVSHLEDTNVLRQFRIERTKDCRRRMIEGDAGAGDLSKRMHPGVRPPGPMDRHRRTFEPGERLFEEALNRFAVRLTLPADKPRPIVGERQLENSHLFTTKVTTISKTTKSPLLSCPSRSFVSSVVQSRDPGLTTGLPSAHSGHCSGS